MTEPFVRNDVRQFPAYLNAVPGPAGAIPARLFDAAASRPPAPVMVFFDGGVFVIGDLDTHAGLCAEASRMLDMPVVAVDYRLAPAVIVSASLDPIRDQSRAFAAALIAGGVPVTFREAAGRIHGFITLRRGIPAAADASRVMAQAVGR